MGYHKDKAIRLDEELQIAQTRIVKAELDFTEAVLDEKSSNILSKLERIINCTYSIYEEIETEIYEMVAL